MASAAFTPVASAAPLTLGSLYGQTVQSDVTALSNVPIFSRPSERMLQVKLDGLVWMKVGAMTAYEGHIKFTREGLFEQGLAKMMKRMVASEGIYLTKAEGQGLLFLSEYGQSVQIIQLRGDEDKFVVNGHNVLAFEPSLEWDIKFMRKAGLIQGGLFNITFKGTGFVAIVTTYTPMTMQVANEHPVMTSLGGAVAWSGNLMPELKFDVPLKTFLGRGSGQAVQLKFAGDSGFVVVQPWPSSHPVKQNLGGKIPKK